MYGNKDICLALGMQLETPIEKQPALLKNAGFTAFAFDKLKNSDSVLTEKLIRAGEKQGLRCEYIHAPFYGMDDIWHDESGELADIMLKDLYATIDECQAFDVKYAVIHAIIGMDNHNPTQLGLERLDALANLANDMRPSRFLRGKRPVLGVLVVPTPIVGNDMLVSP